MKQLSYLVYYYINQIECDKYYKYSSSTGAFSEIVTEKAVSSIVSLSYNENTLYYVKNRGEVYYIDFDNVELNYESFTLKSPVKLNLNKKYVLKVSCGTSHTLFLTYAGTIYSTGSNDKGQLGLGDNCIGGTEPLIIQSLIDYQIKEIYTGNNHNVIFGTLRGMGKGRNDNDEKKELYIFSWGDNSYGQLGNGNINKKCPIPTKLTQLGNNQENQLNIVALTGGFNSTYILFENGELYGFGDNSNHQISLDDNKVISKPFLMSFDFLKKYDIKIVHIISSKNSLLLVTNNDSIVCLGKIFPEEITMIKLMNFDTDVIFNLTDDKITLFYWGKYGDKKIVTDMVQVFKKKKIIEEKKPLIKEDVHVGNQQNIKLTIEKKKIVEKIEIRSGVNKEEKKSSRGPVVLQPLIKEEKPKITDNSLQLNSQINQKDKNQMQKQVIQEKQKSFDIQQQKNALQEKNTKTSPIVQINNDNIKAPNSKDNIQKENNDNIKVPNVKDIIQKENNDNNSNNSNSNNNNSNNSNNSKNSEKFKKINTNEIIKSRNNNENIKDQTKEKSQRNFSAELSEGTKISPPNISTSHQTNLSDLSGFLSIPKSSTNVIESEESIDFSFQSFTSEIPSQPSKLRSFFSNFPAKFSEYNEKLSKKYQKYKSNRKEEIIKDLIKNWTWKKRDLSIKEYFYQGIPNNLRGKIWLLCIKNTSSITRDYFEIEFQKAKTENGTSLKDKNIKIELPFSYLGIFKESSPFSEDLIDIITICLSSRPDIIYNHSLSHIAGILLINMDKFQAYVSLMNIILNPNILCYYVNDIEKIQMRLMIFKQVLYLNLPELCSHLELMNVLPQMYFTEWFMGLYSKNFNVDLVIRIWDVYLIEGIKSIFSSAISILKYFENDLLEMETDEIMDVLHNSTQRKINEDQIIKYIKNVKFESWMTKEIKSMGSIINTIDN